MSSDENWREYLGQEGEKCNRKRPASVWKRWETGEPCQVVREDGGSEVRLESWLNGVAKWQRLKTWGNGWQDDRWGGGVRDELQAEGNEQREFCLVDTRVRHQGAANFTVFRDSWNQTWPRVHPGAWARACDIALPDFRSCPHPETPTPDNSVYQSTKKWLRGIIWERDVVTGQNYRKCKRWTKCWHHRSTLLHLVAFKDT